MITAQWVSDPSSSANRGGVHGLRADPPHPYPGHRGLGTTFITTQSIDVRRREYTYLLVGPGLVPGPARRDTCVTRDVTSRELGFGSLDRQHSSVSRSQNITVRSMFNVQRGSTNVHHAQNQCSTFTLKRNVATFNVENIEIVWINASSAKPVFRHRTKLFP